MIMHRETPIHKINTIVNKTNDGFSRSRSSLVKVRAGGTEGGVGEAEVVGVVTVVADMSMEMGLDVEAIQTRELTP